MGRLKVGVKAIKGVADAVIIEGVALGRVVVAHEVLAPGQLVDVVAEVQEEVGRIGDNLPVSGVVAVLVLLARARVDAQARERRTWRRCRGRATGGTRGLATAEPVPVRPAGLESRGLDVDRVGELRRGKGLAAGRHLPEPVVPGHLPLHGNDGIGLDAPTGRQRHRRESRPQHETVGPRITRRHAEGEGIGAPARNANSRQGHCRQEGGAGEPRQKPAPVMHRSWLEGTASVVAAVATAMDRRSMPPKQFTAQEARLLERHLPHLEAVHEPGNVFVAALEFFHAAEQ
jgi:hypothetical protein